MSEEMKRLLKEELKKDADNIMRETEEDPNVENVKATPELRNKIFEEIRQYEKEQTYKNLPEEYRELVELGKVYKKKKEPKVSCACSCARTGDVSRCDIDGRTGENL